ncbi:15924_t:CDS:2, partial [Racocetra fulgida]
SPLYHLAEEVENFGENLEILALMLKAKAIVKKTISLVESKNTSKTKRILQDVGRRSAAENNVKVFDCCSLGGHEAVLLKNTIYFMGGSRAIPNASPFKSSIRGYNLSNEIFYLDLASSFSTTSPPYVDLSGTSARLQYGNEKC